MFQQFANFILQNCEQIFLIFIKFVAIIFMFVGALYGLKEVSLKKIMFYSTILNIGYVLIILPCNTKPAYFAGLISIIIYLISVLAFFACLAALFGRKTASATIYDINGIGNSRKSVAAGIGITMFSMIGIPPLAGFFGKYYILYQAILNNEFLLTFVCIITSIISSFYYLKVIKSMYFFEKSKEIEHIPTNRLLLFITCAALCFILFFMAVSNRIIIDDLIFNAYFFNATFMA